MSPTPEHRAERLRLDAQARASRATTVLILVVGTIVCFTIAAVVTISVAIPEGANTGTLVALLLANLASVIPALVAAARATQTASGVESLSNGTMDAKIRTALAEVMRPEAIDPAAKRQLEHDKARLQEE